MQRRQRRAHRRPEWDIFIVCRLKIVISFSKACAGCFVLLFLPASGGALLDARRVERASGAGRGRCTRRTDGRVRSATTATRLHRARMRCAFVRSWSPLPARRGAARRRACFRWSHAVVVLSAVTSKNLRPNDTPATIATIATMIRPNRGGDCPAASLPLTPPPRAPGIGIWCTARVLPCTRTIRGTRAIAVRPRRGPNRSRHSD